MICSIKRLRAEANNRALFDISAVNLEGRCCTIYGPSGIGKQLDSFLDVGDLLPR